MSPAHASPFNAFTIAYNGLANRIVTAVKVSEAYDPAAPPHPLPQLVETVALWDTGATRSVLTAVMAARLGLVPVGKANVNHAGGCEERSTYMVNFFLPNNVMASGILVSDCSDIVGDFGAIIGMDIITFGDFSITNAGGRTRMTFRTPSVEAIDYVVDANRQRFAGVQRNAPCPCGKRGPDGAPVKFKRCCGAVGALAHG